MPRLSLTIGSDRAAGTWTGNERLSVLRRSHGTDEGFHVIDVLIQRAAAGIREAVLGARDSSVEGLCAGDVGRVLELASVHAEVAVRRLEQRFQLVEREC